MAGLKPRNRLKPIASSPTGATRQLRKPLHISRGKAKKVPKKRRVPPMSSCISVSIPKHMNVRMRCSNVDDVDGNKASVAASQIAPEPLYA